MSKAVCVACGHSIDAAARLCPYCGADPKTGDKIDTEAVLRETFQIRDVTTSESILEYARHRQGIVVAIGAILAFLVLAGLHQLVTIRNNTAVVSGPAVPLSDIADLSDQPKEGQQLPLPSVPFQFDGHAQAMRTFIVESGAVTPPEVIAAQQAAAQAAAQKAAQAAAAKGAAQPSNPTAAGQPQHVGANGAPVPRPAAASPAGQPPPGTAAAQKTSPPPTVPSPKH